MRFFFIFLVLGFMPHLKAQEAAYWQREKVLAQYELSVLTPLLGLPEWKPAFSRVDVSTDSCLLAGQRWRMAELQEATTPPDWSNLPGSCAPAAPSVPDYLNPEERDSLLAPYLSRGSREPAASYRADTYAAISELLIKAEPYLDAADTDPKPLMAAIDLWRMYHAPFTAAQAEQYLARGAMAHQDYFLVKTAAERSLQQLPHRSETVGLRANGHALLALALVQQKQYQKARRHLAQSSALLRAHPHPPVDQLIAYLNAGTFLARAYAYQGQHQLALALTDSLMPLLAHAPAENLHLQLSGALPFYHFRAQLLTHDRQWSQAMQTLTAADNLLKRLKTELETSPDLRQKSSLLLGTYEVLQAFQHAAWAGFFTSTQDFSSARARFEAAYESLEQTILLQTEINLLNNWAAMETNAQRYDMAYPLLQRAIELAQIKADHPQLIATYLNLGTLYLKSEYYEEAEEALHQALRLSAPQEGSHWRDHAYYRLAYLAYLRGDIRKADSLLRTQVDPPKLEKDLILPVEASYLYGQVAQQLGREEEALQAFERGIAYVDLLLCQPRHRPFVPEMMGEMSWVYEGAALTHLSQGRISAAFAHLAEARSRLTVQAMAPYQDRARQVLPPALADSLLQLDEQLARQTVALMLAEKRNNEPLERSQLQGLARQAQVLRERARTFSPSLTTLAYPAVPSLEEVQGLLHPEETFLMYHVGQDSVYVLMADRNQRVALNLGPRVTALKQLEALQDYFTKRLHKEQPQPARRYQPLAYAAYQTWFAPLQAHVHLLHRRLIVVPHDLLFRVPLHSLVATARAPRGLAELDYLVAHHQWVYTPSPSVWVQDRQTQPSSLREYPRQWLGVGDPIFHAEDSIAWIDRSEIRNAITNGKFGRLPYANTELRRCAQQFPHGSTRLLLDTAATEATFRRLSRTGKLQDYRYVHLATHAWVDPSFRLLAGIAFSRPAYPSEDGLLQPHELMQLNLAPELLVLSACQTAGGAIRGKVGQLSLLYSLRLAGATNLVLSCWSISDRYSAEFFPAFYAYLQTEGAAAAALQQVQRQAAAEGIDPTFWAPFVYFGQ